MIVNLNLEPLNIRRTNPLVIFNQFCVALIISIAEHTIPSTPAKTVTNILSSPGQ